MQSMVIITNPDTFKEGKWIASERAERLSGKYSADLFKRALSELCLIMQSGERIYAVGGSAGGLALLTEQ